MPYLLVLYKRGKIRMAKSSASKNYNDLERNNYTFSKMGWWFGSFQLLDSTLTFAMIFLIDTIKEKFGIDLILWLGNDVKLKFFILGTLHLISAMVLLPPILEKIRLKFSFMKQLYAAPATALALVVIAGIYGNVPPNNTPQQKMEGLRQLASLDKSGRTQAKLQAAIDEINAEREAHGLSTLGYDGEEIPPKTAENNKADNSKKKDEISKFALRGTYYGR
jgi:hypothetical protein